MATYPILPSLSRAPDFATTRKIENGTLSDPMESGYVSTRPRFTRLRRTWGVSWKNLVAGDVQALDQFEVETVQGGAGAFYMPNLLVNGSFEIFEQQFVNGPPDIWYWATSSTADEFQVAISNNPACAALFRTTSGYQLPSLNFVIGQTVTQQAYTPVQPGNVIDFSARIAISLGTLPAGVVLTARAFVQYLQLPGQPGLPQAYGPTVPVISGATDYSASFVVPAGAASSQVGFFVYLVNTTSAPVTLDGSTSLLLNVVSDQVISSVTFDGWYGEYVGDLDEAVIELSTNDVDRGHSLRFLTNQNYSLPPNNPNSGQSIVQSIPVPVTPGDSLLFDAQVNVVRGGLPAGVTVTAQAFATWIDAGGNAFDPQIFAPGLSADTNGFAPYSAIFNVPAGAYSLKAGFYVFLHNSTGAPVVLDGSAYVEIDLCGLAVLSSVRPFGRMPGTSNPATPVRFTKPLTIKDAPWADGEPRFDASCEVTEL